MDVERNFCHRTDISIKYFHSKLRKVRGTQKITYFGELHWESQDLNIKESERWFKMLKFHPNITLWNLCLRIIFFLKNICALQILFHKQETWCVIVLNWVTQVASTCSFQVFPTLKINFSTSISWVVGECKKALVELSHFPSRAGNHSHLEWFQYSEQLLLRKKKKNNQKPPKTQNKKSYLKLILLLSFQYSEQGRTAPLVPRYSLSLASATLTSTNSANSSFDSCMFFLYGDLQTSSDSRWLHDNRDLQHLHRHHNASILFLEQY